LQLSDRIAVISSGQVVYEVNSKEAERNVLGMHMGSPMAEQELSS